MFFSLTEGLYHIYNYIKSIMINIDKNSSNIVVATLTEKSTLLTPNFLFSFSSTTDVDNVVNFMATDTSQYKSRYNIFVVIETGTTFVNLTGGTINLTPPGMWDYNIYESTGVTLSISATTGNILETGKVIVNGEDLTIPEVYR
jgi:hypothetical protein